VAKLERKFDISVRWRAFPLHPDIPPDGMTLEEKFREYPLDIGEMVRRLKKTADELGLPFGERRETFNTRLAQELGLWADEWGAGERFHLAAFRAYFVEGRNLFKMPVLMDLAAEAGLPAAEAEEVMTSRRFKAAVDRDWSDARKLRVTAVPTFLVNGDRLVGAQPYEMLENLLSLHGAGARRETDQ